MRMATWVPSVAELRAVGDAFLHLAAGAHGVVGRRKGRHDLVAHGLDHGAAELLGGLPHDLQALLDGLAGALVAHRLVQMGAADDVRKQYGDFLAYSLSHGTPVTRICKTRAEALYGKEWPRKQCRFLVRSASFPAGFSRLRRSKRPVNGSTSRPRDRQSSRRRRRRRFRRELAIAAAIAVVPLPVHRRHGETRLRPGVPAARARSIAATRR